MNPLAALIQVLAIACGMAATSTHAQDAYPRKPIRFVVPWPPGGASDLIARLIGQKMSESMGQPVVIENRPGAGGMIGSEVVARSAPDGYTMLYGSTGPNAMNASLYKKMPYDPVKDFTPVTQVNVLPLVLMVNPGVPATSVKELIALAKSKPGQINYGSVGKGSAHHFAGEMFKSMAGIDIVHVPYKGSAPALLDLIAGRIQMHFDTIPAAAAHIKAGTVRAIAISSAQRASMLPDLPTVAEAGLPGYEMNAWQTVVVPAGTPTAVVNRLNQEIHKAMSTPEMRDRLAEMGAIVIMNSPEQEEARVRNEVAKWAKAVKDSGMELLE